MDFSKFESSKIKEEFVQFITDEIKKIFKSVKLLQNIVLTFTDGQIDCDIFISYNDQYFDIVEGTVIIDNKEHYNLLSTIEKIKELGGKPTELLLNKVKQLKKQSPITKKDEKIINDFFTDLYNSLSDLNLSFLEHYYDLRLENNLYD